MACLSVLPSVDDDGGRVDDDDDDDVFLFAFQVCHCCGLLWPVSQCYPVLMMMVAELMMMMMMMFFCLHFRFAIAVGYYGLSLSATQ